MSIMESASIIDVNLQALSGSKLKSVTAMSSISEQKVIVVSAPWLSQPVMLQDLIEAEGKLYVKVTKGCNKIARILSGASISKFRALSSTQVLQTLCGLRNQKHAELCKESLDKQADRADEDLGLDAQQQPAKRLKQVAPVLPATLEVITPELDNGESVTMSMITASGSSPLCVEVTQSNIDYLHQACMEQIENKPSVADEVSDTSSKPKGVIWLESRGAFRVNYKVDGMTHQKYFKPESASEADKEAAAEKATAFLTSRSGA